jgi:ferritin-like protein
VNDYDEHHAIALHRIEEYDGQTVTFKYVDKTDGKEKKETISVEEFISRLIRYIPDENFKTIRYYGIYSRRIKTLSKKMISQAAKISRKWIVNVKRIITRRKWRQRIHEQTGQDPYGLRISL